MLVQLVYPSNHRLVSITILLQRIMDSLNQKKKSYSYSNSHANTLKTFFNWKIIALHCYVGFCHAAIQISLNYIDPLLLEPPSHHHPILPLQVVTECQSGFLDLHSSFPLAIYFTHGGAYTFISLKHVTSNAGLRSIITILQIIKSMFKKYSFNYIAYVNTCM